MESIGNCFLSLESSRSVEEVCQPLLLVCVPQFVENEDKDDGTTTQVLVNQAEDVFASMEGESAAIRERSVAVFKNYGALESPQAVQMKTDFVQACGNIMNDVQDNSYFMQYGKNTQNVAGEHVTRVLRSEHRALREGEIPMYSSYYCSCGKGFLDAKGLYKHIDAKAREVIYRKGNSRNEQEDANSAENCRTKTNESGNQKEIEKNPKNGLHMMPLESVAAQEGHRPLDEFEIFIALENKHHCTCGKSYSHKRSLQYHIHKETLETELFEKYRDVYEKLTDTEQMLQTGKTGRSQAQDLIDTDETSNASTVINTENTDQPINDIDETSNASTVINTMITDQPINNIRAMNMEEINQIYRNVQDTDTEVNRTIRDVRDMSTQTNEAVQSMDRELKQPKKEVQDNDLGINQMISDVGGIDVEMNQINKDAEDMDTEMVQMSSVLQNIKREEINEMCVDEKDIVIEMNEISVRDDIFEENNQTNISVVCKNIIEKEQRSNYIVKSTQTSEERNQASANIQHMESLEKNKTRTVVVQNSNNTEEIDQVTAERMQVVEESTQINQSDVVGQNKNNMQKNQMSAIVHVSNLNTVPLEASLQKGDRLLKNCEAKTPMIRGFKCICGESFQYLASLVSHAETHPDYICNEDEVAEKLMEKDPLESAELTGLPAENSSHECNSCGKSFKCSSQLSSHQCCHSSDAPANQKRVCVDNTSEMCLYPVSEDVVNKDSSCDGNVQSGRVVKQVANISGSNDPCDKSPTLQLESSSQQKSMDVVERLVMRTLTTTSNQESASSGQHSKTQNSISEGTDMQHDIRSGVEDLCKSGSVLDVQHDTSDIPSDTSRASRVQTRSASQRADKNLSCHCGKVFKSTSKYLTHTNIHLRNGEYFCDICRKLFRKKMSLAYHLKFHQRIKEYKCFHCDKGFVLHSDFVAHKRNNFFRPRCSTCHTRLHRYLCSRDMRSSNAKHLCKSCRFDTTPLTKGSEKDSVNKSCPMEHSRRSGDLDNTSVTCGEGPVIEKVALDAGEIGMPCGICHKFLMDHSSLEHHWRSHVSDCAVRIEHLSTLPRKQYNNQKDRTTESTEEQGDCMAESLPTVPQGISSHQQKETGTTVTKKCFKCPCGKTFLFRDHFKRHVCIHNGGHPCEICKKVFRRKKVLARHMRMHTGKKKKNTCTICHKSLANSDRMKRHRSRCAKEMTERCAGKEPTGSSCVPSDIENSCEERQVAAEGAVNHQRGGFTCDVCHKLFADSDALEVHKHVWGKVLCNLNKWQDGNWQQNRLKTASETKDHQDRIKPSRQVHSSVEELDSLTQAYSPPSANKKTVKTGEQNFCGAASRVPLHSQATKRDSFEVGVIREREFPAICVQQLPSQVIAFPSPLIYPSKQTLSLNLRNRSLNECQHPMAVRSELKRASLRSGQNEHAVKENVQCDDGSEPVEQSDVSGDEIESHKCTFCKMSFSSVKSLSTHNCTERYKCKICNIQFFNYPNLFSHRCTQKFMCGVCGNLYLNFNAYQNHKPLHIKMIPKLTKSGVPHTTQSLGTRSITSHNTVEVPFVSAALNPPSVATQETHEEPLESQLVSTPFLASSPVSIPVGMAVPLLVNAVPAWNSFVILK